MGSTIITITDDESGEGIDVQMGFDPPIADMDDIDSLAHLVAMDFVEFVTLKYNPAGEAEDGDTELAE